MNLTKVFKLIAVLGLFLFTSGASAHEKRLREVSCIGVGPSLSLARRDAISSCHSNLKSFLVSHLEIDSLVINSEKDAALHEIIRERVEVTGMECVTKSDVTTEEFGQYRVSLTCVYDLSKIKTTGIESKPSVTVSRKESDENFRVFVSTIPACTDVIVKGRNPRRIECKSNPISILVKQGDEKFVFRSTNRLPKEVHATEMKRGQKDEMVIVFEQN